MINQIGNLTFSEAEHLAKKHGYTKYLGGEFVYRGYNHSGHEIDGNPPSGFDGKWVERRVWIDEKMDVLAVIKYEDYGLGQSSSMYFSK